MNAEDLRTDKTYLWAPSEGAPLLQVRFICHREYRERVRSGGPVVRVPEPRCEIEEVITGKLQTVLVATLREDSN